MRYGLLSYCTNNLGDEIQSIAARQFLPAVDVLIDRDRPNHMPPEGQGPCKIIFNGWHTHGPENWPPAAALTPLLISMHITNEVYPRNTSGLRPAQALLEGDNLRYFKAHAPVGTRDLWTLELLRAKGVDAFFSGCLTLTLGSGAPMVRQDYICAVDLPPRALHRLRERVSSRIVVATHIDPPTTSFSDRCATASRLLSLYAHAKCVVTSRLHCALPCLALGTPVLLVIGARDPYRFSGLTDFVRYCTLKAFKAGEADFHADDPQPNGDAFRPYRRALIDQVNAFIEPASATAGLPIHPFVPEGDTDALIAAAEARTHAEADRRASAKNAST